MLTPDDMLRVHEQTFTSMEIALKYPVEGLRVTWEASTKFAEQALRSGFILNGGALVLFSGFAAVFKVNPLPAARELSVVLFAFMVGLIASYCACFLAFNSARAEARAFGHQITATLLTINSASTAITVENHPALKIQREAEAGWRSRASRNGKWAVSLGICSLIGFVFGATFGGWTLMMHAGELRP